MDDKYTFGDFIESVMELLRESVLVSGALAMALVATACYLWISNLAVPEELFILLGTVVGFFFGSKVGGAQTRSEFTKALSAVRVEGPDPCSDQPQ